MPAPTDNMEGEPDKVRLRMVSVLLADFVGPLPDKSHCHICLDSWYPTSSSTGDEEIICKDPVRIDHPNCQCCNIVIGRSCIASWLLEKDTCPMCRQDLFEIPPPHLRTRPPPTPADDEGTSDNEGTSITSDFIDDEYVEDELEEQSWLYSNGNYVHSVTITSGEHFGADEIVELFLNKPRIEAFKTEEEKVEFYATRGGHAAGAWETAYQELVRGRPQKLEDLFTVHGPVCIDGQGVDSW